ncbi:hypothetical protein [Palleronia pelagia]|uniref:hypothetical protein n=1 Tax=Palleronia pelagia TaxID=387096 RepID=UPI001587E0A9|nr:hypothetical protein [Palleronia pelagia]
MIDSPKRTWLRFLYHRGNRPLKLQNRLPGLSRVDRHAVDKAQQDIHRAAAD